ncbi:MAG: ABC transporter substrate-binding protein [Spirochaetales bacterium]|nr:ABC transporter substrate-binding protein [Spirochaetales bacterium]
MATDFIIPAAEDLGIALEIQYSYRNHIHTEEQARAALARNNKPDYLLIGNEKSTAGSLVEMVEEAGVKVFLMNNGFVLPHDIEKYGKPREIYQYWIGQYIPDNISAGYKMGKMLIERALQTNMTDSDGKINLFAIAGTFQTHASDMRVLGLKKAVNEFRDSVRLLQIVPGDWTEDTAKSKMSLAYSRYPHINVVWGVNDATAEGAIRALEERGGSPGKDILFAGCNWDRGAVQLVLEEKMVTTVGGHFMDGAWALVLLYDYHHGIDFINSIPKPEMYSIDRFNVNSYLQLAQENEWDKIDFRSFSRFLNPELKNYDFSIDIILDQVR